MILHLGMSGSLRVLPSATPPSLHDHVDIVLDSGLCLRFNDPRRFGSLLWTDERSAARIRCCSSLAPEPLSDEFDGAYLARAAQGRRVAIKQLIMNSQVVVGVGNIYASEALFRAGIRPRRAAGRVKRAEFDALANSIKAVLQRRDPRRRHDAARLHQPGRNAGLFSPEAVRVRTQRRAVPRVQTPIRHFVQGQRSTYFCPTVPAVRSGSR